MNKKTKEQIKNKIKDYLKVLLLIVFVTILWIIASDLASLV